MTPVKLFPSNSCLTSSTQFCFLISPYQHRAAGPLLSVRSEYECPTTALQVHARTICVCISSVYMCMCVAVEAVEPFLILRRVMIGDLVHSRKIICEFVKHISSFFSIDITCALNLRENGEGNESPLENTNRGHVEIWGLSKL